MPHAVAALAALFAWWISTGAILCANRRPHPAGPLLAMWTVFALSLAGLWLTRDMATAAGAYLAFAAALGVWGWNEFMFLSGRITGPRTTAAPAGLAGLPRLRAATEVVLWHELALAASLGLVAALTAGGANDVGLVTVAALWALRLSAKLNVFLGVRNLSEEFLPPRLAYLPSYFRRSEGNLLLPVSVALGTLAAVALLGPTLAADADPFTVAGGTLTATLVLLGVAEHLFMVAPFSPNALWRWAMAGHHATQR